MSIVQTLAERYQLRHVSGINVATRNQDHTLTVHCDDVAAANALFEDVLLDGITVRIDLLARDLDCPHIEVRVEDQVWLSYDLEDVEAMREIFLT